MVLCGDFNERLDTNVLNAVSRSPDLFPLTADDASDGAMSFVGDHHRSLIDHIIVSRDVPSLPFLTMAPGCSTGTAPIVELSNLTV